MAKRLAGRNKQAFSSLAGHFHAWETRTRVEKFIQRPWLTLLVLERFLSSCIEGGQRNRSICCSNGRSSPTLAPVCRQFSSASSTSVTLTSAKATATAPDLSVRFEKRWEKYFEDPSEWYDNRVSKNNPTDADFEHKSVRLRLWINSPWTPAWVRSKLMENWKLGWAIYPGEIKKAGATAKDVFSAASPQLAGAVQECKRQADDLKKLVEEGCMGEALEKLEDLDLKSLHDPVGVYSFLIKDCCSSRSLDQARRLYTHITTDSDYASSSTLGTALVDMFVKCGSLVEARAAFARLPRHDVAAWNALLSALVSQGYGVECVEAFEELVADSKGVAPNRHTFVAVLRACTALSALADGKLVHALVLDAGLEADSAVGKALVHMYLKLGTLEDAWEVFTRLAHRDVVTSNALIQRLVAADGECDVEGAVWLVEQVRQRDGVRPDAVTYMNVLKGCGSVGALEVGRLVHKQVVEGLGTTTTSSSSSSSSSWGDQLRLGTTLVDMYAKCGNMEDAEKVFAEMPARDVVAWNSLMAGYLRLGRCEEVMSLWGKMQQEGVQGNRGTFVSVLKACSGPSHLHHVEQIHGKALEGGGGGGGGIDVNLGTALVDAYVRCGDLATAVHVFEEQVSKEQPGVWNAMLGGYVAAGRAEDALRLLEQLLVLATTPGRTKVLPDEATFTVALRACADLEALEWGSLVASHLATQQQQLGGGSGGAAVAQADSSAVVVGTALVDMYMSCGNKGDACNVFERLPARDVVAWDTMIAGYAKLGDAKSALQTFRRMQEEEGVQADATTLSRVLNACADSADLDQGKLVHAQGEAQGGAAARSVVVCNSLIDMYAKCGSLDAARAVFQGMPHKTLVSWNAMLAGLAQHGRGAEAVRLFDDMVVAAAAEAGAGGGLQQPPDSHSYVSVLSACSHAGLVDEGLAHFRAMAEKHGVAPSAQHLACVVDMLGRAGRVADAEALVREGAVQPDAVVWMALLGACKRCRDVEVGKRALDRVLAARTDGDGDDAAYVLWAQVLEAAGRWEDAEKVRRLRRRRRGGGGRRKRKLGMSWIATEREVRAFLPGSVGRRRRRGSEEGSGRSSGKVEVDDDVTGKPTKKSKLSRRASSGDEVCAPTAAAAAAGGGESRAPDGGDVTAAVGAACAVPEEVAFA